MSAYSSIHIRSKEVDYIFIATDSVATCNKSIVKNNKILKESYYSFCSKNLYIPHVKTSIFVGGSVWLSVKFHSFIDSARLLQDIDGLILATNTLFHKYIEKEAYETTFENDPSNPNFIGVIILSGPSYKDGIYPFQTKRERSLLMTRKFMIWKDQVKDCGWINSESEDYNGTNIMTASHPQLPNGVQEKVFDNCEELMNQNFQVGSLAILKETLIENNRIYNEGNRETMVTAGEIHATVMALNKDDTFGEGLSVSHAILHKFSDYEDVRNEILIDKST